MRNELNKLFLNLLEKNIRKYLDNSIICLIFASDKRNNNN